MVATSNQQPDSNGDIKPGGSTGTGQLVLDPAVESVVVGL